VIITPGELTRLAASRVTASRRELTLPAARVGDGIRTRDAQIHNLGVDSSKPQRDNELRLSDAPVSHLIPTDAYQNDPGLAAVIEAWDRLAEGVRQSGRGNHWRPAVTSCPDYWGSRGCGTGRSAVSAAPSRRAEGRCGGDQLSQSRWVLVTRTIQPDSWATSHRRSTART
jgi:hypothetical protein